MGESLRGGGGPSIGGELSLSAWIMRAFPQCGNSKDWSPWMYEGIDEEWDVRVCETFDVSVEMVDTLARRMESASGGSEPKINLGLSFPVGPLPRTGLSEGGSLRAERRRLFSSSSTATRSSKASR